MDRTVELAVVSGPMKGRSFLFEEHDTFLCGRMDDCHCCLPDDVQVSRHHFLLEVNPPDVRIRDFGSLNGTYVNGQKIGAREKGESPEQGQRRKYQEAALKDGDEIGVGQTSLKLRIKIPDKGKEPLLCHRCKKDIRAEVGDGRVGDYLCVECRKSIEKDPLLQIAKIAEKEEKQGHDACQIPIRGYQVKGKLGEGGFGCVYLAEKFSTKEQVAIKVLLSRVAVEPEAQEKFLKEIQVMQELRHPNLVRLLDYGSTGGAFFFVMEYCDAGSIADLLRRRSGKLSLDEAIPLMRQSLEGLAFVHQKGHVHRDLKPENILLKGQRQNRGALLGDLGLAKNFEKAGFSGMTMTGAYAGTPVYMPREQLTNYKYVKPASDVWSIAATFYVMITGALPREFPRDKDPMEVILHGQIVPIAARDGRIPRPLAQVLDRALAGNAKDRYQDAGEMLAALKKAV